MAVGRKEIQIYPRPVATTLHGITVPRGGTRSWTRSYRLFFRRPCSSEISLRNPLRTRGTPPPWALPCVSNEFTWRPTVYLRHFLPYVHTRVRRVCVRARAGRPACGQRFPAAADVGPSSRGPPRDTKLGMIIPYLPTEGRDVPSCRILRSTRLDPTILRNIS